MVQEFKPRYFVVHRGEWVEVVKEVYDWWNGEKKVA